MRKNHPNFQWCRYADDGLVHCRTKRDANSLHSELEKRFIACGLRLHPEKTKIVFCNNSRYRMGYKNRKFDFLGYTFRDRWIENPKTKVMFLGFNPGISNTAMKSIRAKIRGMNIRNRTDLTLQQIANILNPLIRGWLEYYGKFNKAALDPVLRYINLTLMAWAMRKFKRIKGKSKAAYFLKTIAEDNPGLFEHWKRGMRGVFA
jgi:hypothetical protein